MRLEAELGHARCSSPAKIVDAPCLDVHRYIQSPLGDTKSAYAGLLSGSEKEIGRPPGRQSMHCLRRQVNDMGLAVLGALLWNGPLTLDNIDLRPLHPRDLRPTLGS